MGHSLYSLSLNSPQQGTSFSYTFTLNLSIYVWAILYTPSLLIFLNRVLHFHTLLLSIYAWAILLTPPPSLSCSISYILFPTFFHLNPSIYAWVILYTPSLLLFLNRVLRFPYISLFFYQSLNGRFSLLPPSLSCSIGYILFLHFSSLSMHGQSLLSFFILVNKYLHPFLTYVLSPLQSMYGPFYLFLYLARQVPTYFSYFFPSLPQSMNGPFSLFILFNTQVYLHTFHTFILSIPQSMYVPFYLPHSVHLFPTLSKRFVKVTSFTNVTSFGKISPLW